MTTNLNHNYSCKNEELPIIGKFVAYSFRRDLNDFTTYSPKFNRVCLTSYETKITEAEELVQPKTETTELKKITETLYLTFNGLIDPINRLTGYINLAHEQIPLSPADFGITALRNGIKQKDAEGIIKNLKTIKTNIAKYKTILTAQGLSEELTAQFVSAETTIGTLKQKQYEILTNRKNLVQENISTLNSLYDLMSEIIAIGKILYKTSNPAKLQEYTFSELKKRVGIQIKTSPETTINTGNAQPAK